MKVNRPGSPLSGGAEPLDPLDPQELQATVKSERFNAALASLEAQAAGGSGEAQSPVRAALAQIADASNLSSSEGAAAAVRESARFMVRSRLHEKFRDTEQGSTLVERLSEFVASDPLLSSKLLGILHKVKTG
jgi:gamma-glutamyl:cysteine ligase YbdK (ATP-grasp superfamily)